MEVREGADGGQRMYTKCTMSLVGIEGGGLIRVPILEYDNASWDETPPVHLYSDWGWAGL